MARRPRNRDLPGTEVETIPQLSKALNDYEDKKVERQEALKEEVKFKDKVIDLMGDHGLLTYRDGDLIVSIIDKSKKSIKVTHVGDPDAE